MKLVYYYDTERFSEDFVKSARSDVRKAFGKETKVLFVPRPNHPNKVVALFDGFTSEDFGTESSTELLNE